MSFGFLTLFIDWARDPYNFSIIAFVIFVIVLLMKDRRKIERDSVILMRRTERGRALLNKIANKSPGFWKYLGSASVFICFGAMVFGVFMILRAMYISLTSPHAGPSLSAVLPVPAQEPVLGYINYGFLGIPFWFWIIPVATVMLIHEGFHGIMMRANKVKIENLGWVFLLVIPGAFVEPDEENLDKSDWKTKLRVFAAGSTGNFILFGVVLLFTTFLFAPTFFSGSINFRYPLNHTLYNVSKPFPADKLDITPGIVSIDENKIGSKREFMDLLEQYSPGDNINLTTTTAIPGKFKTYDVELTHDPRNKTRPFLGIGGVKYHQPTDLSCSMGLPTGFWNNLCANPKDHYMSYGNILLFLRQLLTYIMILNLGIGIFNLLPIKPLDGGLMVETISAKFIPKYSKKIVRISTSLMLAVILASLVLSAI